MTRSPRDKLIQAALELFNDQGFRATGINAILERAGVAKMSLYNNFQSKEDLIAQALRERDAQWMDWFAASIERLAFKGPRAPRTGPKAAAARLLAVFDVLEEWFDERDFNGCGFMRASGEFPDPGDPVHQVALEHKTRIEHALTHFAREAGAKDPESIGRTLFVIASGAIAAAQMTATSAPARDAKAAARAVMQANGLL
jgi:AcrR family transcriptional regulator